MRQNQTQRLHKYLLALSAVASDDTLLATALMDIADEASSISDEIRRLPRASTPSDLETRLVEIKVVGSHLARHLREIAGAVERAITQCQRSTH